MKLIILLFFLFLASLEYTFALTNPQDVSALLSISKEWKNTPPSWNPSGDPCGDQWDGINCTNSRVTQLKLFNMGLEGTLSTSIGDLTELQILDLSYNPKLGGSLPPSIGNLANLTILRLIQCKFGDSIPVEIGNLAKLRILALNSNQFSGNIPASLGKLTSVIWLDVADNQLTGAIPTSSNYGTGLDQLENSLHFHLNKNNLSGSIPDDLFNSNLKVIHILLDGNNLTGKIPETIGLLKNITILRFDKNFLNGPVPASINNLTTLYVLNLANNELTGPMPDMSGLTALNYLDLSYNNFDSSEVPAWFLDVQNLTTLIIESGGLQGQVPQALFSFPKLQEVRLGDNLLNGILDMGTNTSEKLKTVNFTNNAMTSVLLSSDYNFSLLLAGNPVCNSSYLKGTPSCGQEQQDLASRLADEVSCSHPYECQLMFRAPFFRVIQGYADPLQNAVNVKFNDTSVIHSLSNYYYDTDSYLHVLLKICPTTQTYFTRSDILSRFDFSTSNMQMPVEYGPYYPNCSPYDMKPTVHRGWIIGVAVASATLVLAIFAIGLYAIRQKKQAKKAIALTNPFASWGSDGSDTGEAPQLKGAKFFSFEEIKTLTNGFSDNNIIGSGGYGDVFKGLLSDGKVVAIKRSKKGSMQGGLEFKTEIELLSRVHHKNLVELVGFCFDKGERTLVYEYISNGTLRDNLAGGRKELDWGRRIKIALDSAKGLAYLHENANPPIIHRDVKSTNILLDESFTAKVADFGLSKLVADSEVGTVSTTVKGTLGYLDPEYYMSQQLTGKSDVYSLGVVMLELVTGKLPIEKNKYVVREVRMALDENDKEFYGLRDLIDPLLLKMTRFLDGFHSFVDLALQCVSESGENRPTMSEVVKEIDVILKNSRAFADSASVSSSSTEFASQQYRAEYDSKYLLRSVN